MATCRSCNAPMIWATSPAGAALPLDAAPLTGEGDPRMGPRVVYYLLEEDKAIVVDRADAAWTTNALIYVSHFISCPNASQHSKQRKQERLI